MEDRHRSDPAGPEHLHRPGSDRLHGRARAQFPTSIVVPAAPPGPADVDALDDTLVQVIDDVLRADAPVVWGQSPASGQHAARGAGTHTRAAGDPATGPTPSPGSGSGPVALALRRALTTARDYVPRGNTLDPETFRHRHQLLCAVLALHLPALLIFGLTQGHEARGVAFELLVPAVCLVVAHLARNRRVAAFHVTAGLVFCSSVLVQLSGGMIEAHFHFFVLIGLIALYQDWVPFMWDVAFTVVSHGVGSAVAADAMFNHHAGQQHPWTWALIHGLAVLAGCVGVIVFWRHTEIEQRRSTVLAEDLAAARVDAAQQQSVSELFVNLARRNQALLDRQLELITDLENRERSPEALEDLFQLDHLATRIRRNAESLLVLSGDEPFRRWGRPVGLTEVVRAAAAEIEDYRRVEVLVTEHLELAGQAVADMAHLLAELIENATCFSPPRNPVEVRSHAAPTPGARCLLTIEDTGFGMSDADLERANEVLADPPDLDLRDRTLGFQVVGRLARRYGVQVRLAPTPGGGVTAVVSLPDSLVSDRSPAPARPLHAHRTKAATERSTEQERKRAMLSRFQASQRAGKAVAGAPAGSLARSVGAGRHVTEEGA